MAVEFSGAGDPRRTIELLWNRVPPAAKGPKPKLSVGQVTAVAVELADAEGIAKLSIRRLAGRIGVGTMSLYTYVPSKEELIDLMVDRVLGEVLGAYVDVTDWRSGLELVAHTNHGLFQRHPWLLTVSTGRAPLGPNVTDKYEQELGVIEGIGLSDVEMDSVLSLVIGHTEATARRAADAAEVVQRTGLTDEQWWAQSQPVLDEVLDQSRYPLSSRVGRAAGEAHNAASDAATAFEFGLARILDGVSALVTSRSG